MRRRRLGNVSRHSHHLAPLCRQNSPCCLESGAGISRYYLINTTMSSNPNNKNADAPDGAQNTNQKTLQVWSEPLKPADQERLQANSSAAGSPVKISDAVSTIKKEDFLNVAQMPCARGGLLTGIASGAVAGGLRFVARGMMSRPKRDEDYILMLLHRKRWQGCQLGRWVLPSWQRRILRILPVPATSRTYTNATDH